MSRSRWGKFRDRLARSIANWALVNIATFDYQKKIYGLIRLGLAEADRRMETANFLSTKEQPHD